MMGIEQCSIENVKLENNVFLAPMAGVTDKAFRKICAQMGAGLVYTEMVSAKGIVYNDKKTMDLIDCDIENMPRAVQIFGSEPEIIYTAIQKIEQYADIIDINMGCPVPKIVNNGEGSALLKQPKLIGKIVKSAVEATQKPITVKVRIGWDDNSINVLDVAKVIQDNGAKAITVHGRTRQDFYSGVSRWEYIKAVKETVNIPVIGNGDVKDFESFNKMLNETNVEAVMIGRAALGNPFVFRNILSSSKEVQVTKEELLDVILKHYMLEVGYKGEYTAIREMRKHICWYIKGLPNNTQIKNLINMSDNLDEVTNILKEYLSN